MYDAINAIIFIATVLNIAYVYKTKINVEDGLSMEEETFKYFSILYISAGSFLFYIMYMLSIEESAIKLLKNVEIFGIMLNIASFGLITIMSDHLEVRQ